MNERIQQVIFSLNEKVGVHWINEGKIKFAELIVLKCAQFVEDKFDFCGDEIIVKEKMLEHLGVEE